MLLLKAEIVTKNREAMDEIVRSLDQFRFSRIWYKSDGPSINRVESEMIVTLPYHLKGDAVALVQHLLAIPASQFSEMSLEDGATGILYGIPRRVVRNKLLPAKSFEELLAERPLILDAQRKELEASYLLARKGEWHDVAEPETTLQLEIDKKAMNALEHRFGRQVKQVAVEMAVKLLELLEKGAVDVPDTFERHDCEMEVNVPTPVANKILEASLQLGLTESEFFNYAIGYGLHALYV